MQRILQKNEKISHQRAVGEIFHSFMAILGFVRLGVFRCENGLKLLSAHRFVREQELRHGDKLRPIAREDGLAALISRIHDGLDLLIDLRGDLLGIGLGLRHRASDENFIVPGFKRDRAEPFAHAVHRDHLARDLRGALNVVRRAGRNIAEHQLFRHAPAEQRDDLLFHIALGLI